MFAVKGKNERYQYGMVIMTTKAVMNDQNAIEAAA